MRDCMLMILGSVDTVTGLKCLVSILPFDAATLVYDVRNSKPTKDCFEFPAVASQLERSGSYLMQFVVSAGELPGRLLESTVTLHVEPERAIEFVLQVHLFQLPYHPQSPMPIHKSVNAQVALSI